MSTRRPPLLGQLGIAVLVLTLALPRLAAGGGGAALNDATETNASDIATEADLLGAFGAYWDADASEVALVFPSNASGISAMQFAGRGVGVRIERAAVSDGEFLQVKKDVAALVDAGKLKGETTEVALDLQSGKLEITSTASEAIFSEQLSRLGDAVVFRPAKGAFRRLSRINDSEPYWGGGEVVSNTGVENVACSSGFTVLKSGAAWMTTAGHCFPNENFVHDGVGDAYGQVLYQIFPLRDVELIGNKQYGAWIWLGTLTSPSWGHVSGAANPLVGTNYCSSGFKTLEKCGMPATGVNVYSCDNNGDCTDKMVRFSGVRWVDGDSGGPIFYKYSTNPITVQAKGTIIGDWNGNSYGQQWSGIVDAFGVTICTRSSGACP
jgi:hypothetical protein